MTHFAFGFEFVTTQDFWEFTVLATPFVPFEAFILSVNAQLHRVTDILLILLLIRRFPKARTIPCKQQDYAS